VKDTCHGWAHCEWGGGHAAPRHRLRQGRETR